MKVFVSRRIPQAGLELLTSDPTLQIEVWPESLPPTAEQLRERVSGASGLLTLLSDRIDAEVMQAAGPQLRVIANYAVGFNNIDLSAAQERGIRVGNTPDVLTDATADIAVGLLIAAARHFQAASDQVRQRQWRTWEPLGLLGQELSGKRLGIIGMGRIGLAVAQRLHGGWGMQVRYTARSPKPDAERLCGAERVELEELMATADFISLHAPLTPETRHLIGHRLLSLCQPHCVLVNTARGELIDQHALYQALHQGQLFAAGLDVTEPEPIADESPLRQLSNCLILPHIGSATFEARAAMARMAAGNILAGLKDQPLPYPVG
jgi:glyoxylate reductase